MIRKVAMPFRKREGGPMERLNRRRLFLPASCPAGGVPTASQIAGFKKGNFARLANSRTTPNTRCTHSSRSSVSRAHYCPDVVFNFLGTGQLKSRPPTWPGGCPEQTICAWGFLLKEERRHVMLIVFKSYFCPVRASYSARPSSRQSFGIQDDNASRRPAFNVCPRIYTCRLRVPC